MSSKTKSIATKEEASPALVPKLRFPEFRGAEAWTAETLEDALAMSATYGIVTAGEFQREGIPMLRGGDIKEGRIGDGLPLVTAEIHSQYRRTTLQADDVVISLVGYPGEAAVVPKHYVGANISRAVGLLRVKRLLSAPFLVCYLNSPQGRRTVLKPSAGSAQVVVNLKQLNALLIPAPSPAEQQKIAECLSSVDELMAAQARKVDALKTHKKGLMQQLFPREGETQPRLRFPEFQNAGEWEEKSLREICERIMDGTHFSPKTKKGPRPYLTSKNIRMGWLDLSTVSYIAEEEHQSIYARCPVKKNDVLLTKDGANTGNCAINTIDHDFSLLSSVAVLRGDSEQVTQQFLFQSIVSDCMQSTIVNSMSGQAITRITLEKLGNYKIPVPPVPEQQRIATCLSSLDALITAETQKLEALKTHKKGLMQQLFPSPKEVAG